MPRLVTGKPLCALGMLALLAGVLGGCGGRLPSLPGDQDGPGDLRDVSHVPDAVPRVEPRSRGGNPKSYVVLGKRYRTLPHNRGFVQRGVASWYGTKFHGRRTSNGEVYDMYSMSAAHKRLPIPTYLEVTNLENGRRVVVRVNDRGPFHDNRIVDLSYAAAARIGMLGKGTALVEIRALNPSSPDRRPIAQVAQAPAPKTAAAAPVPRIFLQAGAFSNSDNARRLRQRLEQALARDVRIVRAPATRGEHVHRVQVGPLVSVEIADQVSAKMHNLGITEPLVVID